MEFKTATDRAAAACITLRDVAEACDVSLNTIDRARLAASSPNARPAPAGWQAAVAGLARARGTELLRLADELEQRAAKRQRGRD